MKKYYRPSTKLFVVLSAFCILIFAVGLVLAFADFEQINLTFFLISFGGLNGIIFIAAAIAQYCSYLQMDETTIIFYRSVRIIKNNGSKRIVAKKLIIPFSDIKSISHRCYKGDDIISKDTTFYVFELKNGDVFEETFYNYGKQQQEIINTLKEM